MKASRWVGWAASLSLAAGLACQGCGGTSVVGGGGGTGQAGGVGTGGAAGAGGHAAGGHGLGGDGGAGGSTACGDPAVLSRYADCLAADDQPSCELAGGTWDTIGLAPEPECQCPTGQSACSCTRPSECLSACLAETLGGPFECDGVVVGHCAAVSIAVGCWCFFDDSGVPSGICVD